MRNKNNDQIQRQTQTQIIITRHHIHIHSYNTPISFIVRPFHLERSYSEHLIKSEKNRLKFNGTVLKVHI